MGAEMNCIGLEYPMKIKTNSHIGCNCVAVLNNGQPHYHQEQTEEKIDYSCNCQGTPYGTHTAKCNNNFCGFQHISKDSETMIRITKPKLPEKVQATDDLFNSVVVKINEIIDYLAEVNK